MTTIGNYIKSKGSTAFPIVACYNSTSSVDACDDNCE
jgi:hypothetical protein